MIAGQVIQPLNHTAIFLIQTEIVLLSDSWKIVLDIQLSTYTDTISTIRSDLMLIEQQKHEFTCLRAEAG
jgi:hypothetical protein